MNVRRSRFLLYALAALAAHTAFAQTPPLPRRPGTEEKPSAAPADKSGPVPTVDAAKKGADFGAAQKKQVRFHMDFDKVDIAEVVKYIANWTGKNFILGENIRGKITILGPTDVTADEAYNGFVVALNMNNMGIVKTGEFYKILSKKDIAKDNPQTFLLNQGHIPDSEQVVTKLFRLKYTEAEPIKGVISNFTSPEAQLVTFAPDLLIVSDIATNIARIERILSVIDVPGGQDEINVIQMYYATAQEISAVLLQIFQPQGAQGGAGAREGGRRPQIAVPAGSPIPFSAAGAESGPQAAATVTKILPDERSNKLIVVASPKAFQRIAELVKKLDVPINTNQIHVYYLSNSDAEEVATVISNIAQGTQSTQRKSTTGAAAPPPPPGGAAPTAGSGAQFTGQIKVTADKSTNSLLIAASPMDYLNLLKVLDKLDVRRRQVFIEAVIMEVKLNDEDSHSADLHTGYGIPNVSVPGATASTVPLIVGSEPSGGATSLSLAGLASMSGFIAGVQGPPITVNGLNITLPAFGVVLNALEKNSDVNVISTPHILTSDNNEAEIEVGETVPFQTAVPALGGLASLASSSSTGTTSPISTLGGLGLGLGGLAPIQRQPVELRLKIKPHINESDFIRLEIDEQDEEIASQDPQRGPTTSKRAIKTTVVAKDQSTVVIGGLIQDRTTRSESKFPILGSIPILSFFFGNYSETKEKTNLLLFLTPYIIRDQGDFRNIFERKMKERQEFVARFFGTSEKYAVTVDYDRKRGPLGIIREAIKHEFNKIENGGPGLPNQTLIKPDVVPPFVAPPPPPPPPSDEAPISLPPGTVAPEAPTPAAEAPTPAVEAPPAPGGAAPVAPEPAPGGGTP